MLRPSKPSQPIAPDPARHAQDTLRALRTAMLTADDVKIRRIVGLLDVSTEHEALQSMLDPLRPRLAALRPIRPLRFTRLLFIPMNELLVPARGWKPGQAAIPRTVLQAIANTVRVGLGQVIETIERLIAGHDTDDLDVVARAGGWLWPRAGELLAKAPAPVGWAETGLPPGAYEPLAMAIATILRRAVGLRRLVREAELGVVQPNEAAIAEIVAGLDGEPVAGRVLLMKLMIAQFPNAAAMLRSIIDSGDMAAERSTLLAALNAGAEDLLSEIEQAPALTGSLAEVGIQAQRMVLLLQDLTKETDSPHDLSRLRAVREKLSVLCRDRFQAGVQDGLVSPLSASVSPVDAATQKQLESSVRDIRSVETVGRKLGSGATYDASLARAHRAVEAAAKAGILSRTRAVRLVEVLVGAEEAERLYQSMQAKA